MMSSIKKATIQIQEYTDNDVVLMVQLPDDVDSNTIRWTRNNQRSLSTDRFKPYNSRKKSSLIIRQLTLEDSDRYRAESEDSYGTSFLASIDLNVSKRSPEVPIFLKRLHDVSVKIGARTRFLVEVESIAPLKVSWYRDNLLLKKNERLNFLEKSNYYCLDVAWTMLQDEGHWTCIAENKYGCSISSSYLTVLVPKAYKPPQFVEDLKAILSEDSTVSLECKVVGVPTPNLLWYKDGKKIKAGDTFALRADTSDASSLGTYSCVAKNCLGQAFSSSSVHLQKDQTSSENGIFPLGPRPKFIRELQNAEAQIEHPLTLNCQVVVPPWPKSIDWYNKNGRITEDDRYKLLADGLGMYALEIQSVEMIDDGEWKCVATSFFGIKAYSSCYVTVKFPKNYKTPKFLENLQAVMTPEGLVSFECKVIGYPTPHLRWLKDGKELKPGDVYQLTGTNSLGTYCCIAKNSMGEIESTTVLTLEDIQGQLTEEERLLIFAVNQPPYFIKGLKSLEAKINEEYEFTVQVSAKPDAKVLWYRNDKLIESNERITMRKENHGNFILHFKRLELDDQAEWKCIAVNDYGQSVTSCFIKLTIPKHFKAPRFLEELKAIFTEDGTVNLECKVIGVPQPELKWYKDGKHLKPGEMHKIISGRNGKCCLGTYSCAAINCMATTYSSASLLAFEDQKLLNKGGMNELDILSIITEERTSQLNEPSDKSTTYEEAVGPSFSFDGKEVSISLYETPDLTDEEALQIVEMYADELTEHISNQNIVELPSLRFIKETVTSGNILMEATVIDVPADEFLGEEELKTDIDAEYSLMDEPTQAPQNQQNSDHIPINEKEFSPPSESCQSNEKSPGKSIITLEKIDISDEKMDTTEFFENSDNKSCTNKYSLLIKNSFEEDTLNDTSVTDTAISESSKNVSEDVEKKIITENLSQKRSHDSEDDSLHEFEKLKSMRKSSKEITVESIVEDQSQISVLESIAFSIGNLENGLDMVHQNLVINKVDEGSVKMLESLLQPIKEIKNNLQIIQDQLIFDGEYETSEILQTLSEPISEFKKSVSQMEKYSQSHENDTLKKTSQYVLNIITEPMEELNKKINIFQSEKLSSDKVKIKPNTEIEMIQVLENYTPELETLKEEIKNVNPEMTTYASEIVNQMELIQQWGINLYHNALVEPLPIEDTRKFHNAIVKYLETNFTAAVKLQEPKLEEFLREIYPLKTDVQTTLKVTENVSPLTAINYLTTVLEKYSDSGESILKKLKFSNDCIRCLDDSIEIILNSVNTIQKCSEVEKNYQKKRILMTLCNLKLPLQDLLYQLRNIPMDSELKRPEIYKIVNDVSIPLQVLRKEIGLLFHQSYSGQILELISPPLKCLQDEISSFHDSILSKEPTDIDIDHFLTVLNKLNFPFCEIANKIMQVEDLVVEESPVVSDPKLGIRIVMQSVASLVDVLTDLQHSNHSTSLVLSKLTNPLIEVRNSLKLINDQFYEEDLEKVNITMLKTLSSPFNAFQKELIDISLILTGDIKHTIKDLQRTILTIQDQVSFEYGDEPASIEYNMMTLQTLLHPINVLKNHCLALKSENGKQLAEQWAEQMKTVNQIENILLSMDTKSARVVRKMIQNYKNLIKTNNSTDHMKQLRADCNEIRKLDEFAELEPYIRRLQDNIERIIETQPKNIIERLLSNNDDFENILHILTTYKEEDNVKCFIALLQSLNIIRTLQESVRDSQNSSTDSMQIPMLHSFLSSCEKLENKISDLLYAVENTSERVVEFYPRTVDAFSTLNNQLLHLNKCLIDQSVSDDDQKEIPFESSIRSFNCLLALVNSEESPALTPIKVIIKEFIAELVKLQSDILFNMSLIQSEDEISLNESEFEEISLKPDLVSVCFESMKKEIVKCDELLPRSSIPSEQQASLAVLNTSLESISNIINFIHEHKSFDSDIDVSELNEPISQMLKEAHQLEILSRSNLSPTILLPKILHLSQLFENFKTLVQQIATPNKTQRRLDPIASLSVESSELENAESSVQDESLQSELSSSADISNITTVVYDDHESSIKQATRSITPSSDLITAIERHLEANDEKDISQTDSVTLEAENCSANHEIKDFEQTEDKIRNQEDSISQEPDAIIKNNILHATERVEDQQVSGPDTIKPDEILLGETTHTIIDEKTDDTTRSTKDSEITSQTTAVFDKHEKDQYNAKIEEISLKSINEEEMIQHTTKDANIAKEIVLSDENKQSVESEKIQAETFDENKEKLSQDDSTEKKSSTAFSQILQDSKILPELETEKSSTQNHQDEINVSTTINQDITPQLEEINETNAVENLKLEDVKEKFVLNAKDQEIEKLVSPLDEINETNITTKLELDDITQISEPISDQEMKKSASGPTDITEVNRIETSESESVKQTELDIDDHKLKNPDMKQSSGGEEITDINITENLKLEEEKKTLALEIVDVKEVSKLGTSHQKIEELTSEPEKNLTENSELGDMEQTPSESESRTTPSVLKETNVVENSESEDVKQAEIEIRDQKLKKLESVLGEINEENSIKDKEHGDMKQILESKIKHQQTGKVASEYNEINETNTTENLKLEEIKTATVSEIADVKHIPESDISYQEIEKLVSEPEVKQKILTENVNLEDIKQKSSEPRTNYQKIKNLVPQLEKRNEESSELDNVEQQSKINDQENEKLTSEPEGIRETNTTTESLDLENVKQASESEIIDTNQILESEISDQEIKKLTSEPEVNKKSLTENLRLQDTKQTSEPGCIHQETEILASIEQHETVSDESEVHQLTSKVLKESIETIGNISAEEAEQITSEMSDAQLQDLDRITSQIIEAFEYKSQTQSVAETVSHQVRPKSSEVVECLPQNNEIDQSINPKMSSEQILEKVEILDQETESIQDEPQIQLQKAKVSSNDPEKIITEAETFKEFRSEIKKCSLAVEEEDFGYSELINELEISKLETALINETNLEQPIGNEAGKTTEEIFVTELIPILDVEIKVETHANQIESSEKTNKFIPLKNISVPTDEDIRETKQILEGEENLELLNNLEHVDDNIIKISEIRTSDNLKEVSEAHEPFTLVEHETKESPEVKVNQTELKEEQTISETLPKQTQEPISSDILEINESLQIDIEPTSDELTVLQENVEDITNFNINKENVISEALNVLEKIQETIAQENKELSIVSENSPTTEEVSEMISLSEVPEEISEPNNLIQSKSEKANEVVVLRSAESLDIAEIKEAEGMEENVEKTVSLEIEELNAEFKNRSSIEVTESENLQREILENVADFKIKNIDIQESQTTEEVRKIDEEPELKLEVIRKKESLDLISMSEQESYETALEDLSEDNEDLSTWESFETDMDESSEKIQQKFDLDLQKYFVESNEIVVLPALSIESTDLISPQKVALQNLTESFSIEDISEPAESRDFEKPSFPRSELCENKIKITEVPEHNLNQPTDQIKPESTSQDQTEKVIAQTLTTICIPQDNIINEELIFASTNFVLEANIAQIKDSENLDNAIIIEENILEGNLRSQITKQLVDISISDLTIKHEIESQEKPTEELQEASSFLLQNEEKKENFSDQINKEQRDEEKLIETSQAQVEQGNDFDPEEYKQEETKKKNELKENLSDEKKESLNDVDSPIKNTSEENSTKKKEQSTEIENFLPTNKPTTSEKDTKNKTDEEKLKEKESTKEQLPDEEKVVEIKLSETYSTKMQKSHQNAEIDIIKYENQEEKSEPKDENEQKNLEIIEIEAEVHTKNEQISNETLQPDESTIFKQQEQSCNQQETSKIQKSEYDKTPKEKPETSNQDNQDIEKNYAILNENASEELSERTPENVKSSDQNQSLTSEKLEDVDKLLSNDESSNVSGIIREFMTDKESQVKESTELSYENEKSDKRNPDNRKTSETQDSNETIVEKLEISTLKQHKLKDEMMENVTNINMCNLQEEENEDEKVETLKNEESENTFTQKTEIDEITTLEVQQQSEKTTNKEKTDDLENQTSSKQKTEIFEMPSKENIEETKSTKEIQAPNLEQNAELKEQTSEFSERKIEEGQTEETTKKKSNEDEKKLDKEKPEITSEILSKEIGIKKSSKNEIEKKSSVDETLEKQKSVSIEDKTAEIKPSLDIIEYQKSEKPADFEPIEVQNRKMTEIKKIDDSEETDKVKSSQENSESDKSSEIEIFSKTIEQEHSSEILENDKLKDGCERVTSQEKIYQKLNEKSDLNILEVKPEIPEENVKDQGRKETLKKNIEQENLCKNTDSAKFEVKLKINEKIVDENEKSEEKSQKDEIEEGKSKILEQKKINDEIAGKHSQEKIKKQESNEKFDSKTSKEQTEILKKGESENKLEQNDSERKISKTEVIQQTSEDKIKSEEEISKKATDEEIQETEKIETIKIEEQKLKTETSETEEPNKIIIEKIQKSRDELTRKSFSDEIKEQKLEETKVQESKEQILEDIKEIEKTQLKSENEATQKKSKEEIKSQQSSEEIDIENSTEQNLKLEKKKSDEFSEKILQRKQSPDKLKQKSEERSEAAEDQLLEAIGQENKKATSNENITLQESDEVVKIETTRKSDTPENQTLNDLSTKEIKTPTDNNTEKQRPATEKISSKKSPEDEIKQKNEEKTKEKIEGEQTPPTPKKSDEKTKEINFEILKKEKTEDELEKKLSKRKTSKEKIKEQKSEEKLSKDSSENTQTKSSSQSDEKTESEKNGEKKSKLKDKKSPEKIIKRKSSKDKTKKQKSEEKMKNEEIKKSESRDDTEEKCSEEKKQRSSENEIAKLEIEKQKSIDETAHETSSKETQSPKSDEKINSEKSVEQDLIISGESKSKDENTELPTMKKPSHEEIEQISETKEKSENETLPKQEKIELEKVKPLEIEEKSKSKNETSKIPQNEEKKRQKSEEKMIIKENLEVEVSTNEDSQRKSDAEIESQERKENKDLEQSKTLESINSDQKTPENGSGREKPKKRTSKEKIKSEDEENPEHNQISETKKRDSKDETKQKQPSEEAQKIPEISEQKPTKITQNKPNEKTISLKSEEKTDLAKSKEEQPVISSERRFEENPEEIPKIKTSKEQIESGEAQKSQIMKKIESEDGVAQKPLTEEAQKPLEITEQKLTDKKTMLKTQEKQDSETLNEQKSTTPEENQSSDEFAQKPTKRKTSKEKIKSDKIQTSEIKKQDSNDQTLQKPTNEEAQITSEIPAPKLTETTQKPPNENNKSTKSIVETHLEKTDKQKPTISEIIKPQDESTEKIGSDKAGKSRMEKSDSVDKTTQNSSIKEPTQKEISTQESTKSKQKTSNTEPSDEKTSNKTNQKQSKNMIEEGQISKDEMELKFEEKTTDSKRSLDQVEPEAKKPNEESSQTKENTSDKNQQPEQPILKQKKSKDDSKKRKSQQSEDSQITSENDEIRKLSKEKLEIRESNEKIDQKNSDIKEKSPEKVKRKSSKKLKTSSVEETKSENLENNANVEKKRTTSPSENMKKSEKLKTADNTETRSKTSPDKKSNDSKNQENEIESENNEQNSKIIEELKNNQKPEVPQRKKKSKDESSEDTSKSENEYADSQTSEGKPKAPIRKKKIKDKQQTTSLENENIPKTPNPQECPEIPKRKKKSKDGSPEKQNLAEEQKSKSQPEFAVSSEADEAFKIKTSENVTTETETLKKSSPLEKVTKLASEKSDELKSTEERENLPILNDFDKSPKVEKVQKPTSPKSKKTSISPKHQIEESLQKNCSIKSPIKTSPSQPHTLQIDQFKKPFSTNQNDSRTLSFRKQKLILDKYPNPNEYEFSRDFHPPRTYSTDRKNISHSTDSEISTNTFRSSNKLRIMNYEEFSPYISHHQNHHEHFPDIHKNIPRDWKTSYDPLIHFQGNFYPTKYSQNLSNKNSENFSYTVFSQPQTHKCNELLSRLKDYMSYVDQKQCSSREIEYLLNGRPRDFNFHHNLYFVDIIPMQKSLRDTNQGQNFKNFWDLSPTFKRLYADNTVPVGSTLALHAEIEGTPKPDVEWLREEKLLPSNLFKYRYIEDVGLHTLLITDISYNEAGKYSCKASNKYGSTNVTTNVFVIRTTGIKGGKPPMFISRPDTILSVNSGSDVSVSFRLSGDPRPKVIWMKGLTDITDTHRTMKETVNDYTRLTLTRAQLSDSGTYFIIVKNKYGSDRAFFTLRVNQRSRSLTPLPSYRFESESFENRNSLLNYSKFLGPTMMKHHMRLLKIKLIHSRSYFFYNK